MPARLTPLHFPSGILPKNPIQGQMVFFAGLEMGFFLRAKIPKCLTWQSRYGNFRHLSLSNFYNGFSIAQPGNQ